MGRAFFPAKRSKGEGREIRITFDDGNQSDIAIALPILKTFGLPACFFSLADRIGSQGFLEASDIPRLSDAGRRSDLTARAQVKWTILDGNVLVKQVSRSLRVLSGLLQKPITIVAIPFGARVLNVLSRLAIGAVCTSDGGPARAGERIKPRDTMRADMPIEAVEELESGHLGAIPRPALEAPVLLTAERSHKFRYGKSFLLNNSVLLE